MQEHVGIRNKNYAGKIAAHLETLGPDEESRGDEQEQQQQQQRKPRVTLCVEGNISAGKSTFLDMLTRFQLQEIVEVLPLTSTEFLILATGTMVLKAHHLLFSSETGEFPQHVGPAHFLLLYCS